jgi:DNA-directed RNA polymerase sigma subunit (sigma70/sigma32)
VLATFAPLIASTARHYRGTGAAEHTELMQAGTVGLLRAVHRYDPALGTPVWTSASWWVRQAMQQHTSRERLGRLSTHEVQLLGHRHEVAQLAQVHANRAYAAC